MSVWQKEKVPIDSEVFVVASGLHAWVVNVCWKCWTVTEEKRI